MVTEGGGDIGSEAVLVKETRAGRFQVAVQASGSRFLVDEPVAFGGLASGPNPYDLLAAALGACMAMTIRLYAERKSWRLSAVTVRVGHMRATLKARDHFDREIIVEGGLDNLQRAKLLEIANRCPVHLTLERGADVSTLMVHALPASSAISSAVGQHVKDMKEASSTPDKSAGI